MCSISSKSIGKVFVLALVLSWLALPVYSQEGKTFTAAQRAAFQGLSKTLADLQQTNKQQADKILNLEKQLAIASQQQTELQATIDSQAGKLTELRLNLTSSAQTLASNETWKIIGWTVAGLSILGNIGQAFIPRH